MTVQRILVIANGNCDTETVLRCCELKPELVICVDGGLRHCRSAGLEPDVLIGDMDSIEPTSVDQLDTEKTRFIRHSPDKDATDLELALQYINDTFVDAGTDSARIEILLAGISGGRTDHMLANWLVLSSDRWMFDIVIKERSGDGYLIRPGSPATVELEPETTFSLLALRHSTGVACSGARYPLVDAELFPDTALGISNESMSNNVQVSINSGVLLLYANDS